MADKQEVIRSNQGPLIIVVCVVSLVACVERPSVPATLQDAQKELATAEKACQQWQRELAEHPEYLKSNSIVETDRKTKTLCEVAIKDASLDVEAVQIRHKESLLPSKDYVIEQGTGKRILCPESKRESLVPDGTYVRCPDGVGVVNVVPQ